MPCPDAWEDGETFRSWMEMKMPMGKSILSVLGPLKSTEQCLWQGRWIEEEWGE